MSFSVPTFNLTVNVWHYPAVPPAAPSLVTVGNLAYGKRGNIGFEVISSSGAGTMTLLLPPNTDIRSLINATSADYVEAPAGSGRYYTTAWVDDIGKGFSNEHRAAVLSAVRVGGPWPTPIP